jgi:polyphosphate glucokinase
VPARGVGIDVGGTGIKAAIVELATGALASPRLREKTPDPSTPQAVADTAARLLDRLRELGHDTAGLPTGVGLPGVVKAGRLMTAANIDKGWVNAPAEAMFGERLGRPVRIINDADAAGIAELRFGAGAGRRGVVLLLTIGTGIGSALFVDGHLVPNTEFGHLEFHGRDAESLVSGVARERRKMSWKRWAHEFGAFLDCLDRWFSPDLLILGGGVSKESARFLRYITPPCPIETARLLNSAGIVGAAMAAAEGIAVAEGRAAN